MLAYLSFKQIVANGQRRMVPLSQAALTLLCSELFKNLNNSEQ